MKIPCRALAILVIAALPTIAMGQPRFTATGDPVSITSPGGTGTATVKVKYQCDGCTTPYSGGWELFEGVSTGFELVGEPKFTCDPLYACSVTTPNCMPVDPQFGQIGCFAQATMAPGATITETQTIKQQTGGPATGTVNDHVGEDIDSIRLMIPITVTTTAACPTITIRPDTLAEMTVGVPAAIHFSAENGTPPYTWKLSRLPSDFPAGLGIGGFPNNPVIEGAPLTTATLDFNATVTDSTPSPPGPCTASKSYTLIVKPAAGQPHFVITKSVDPKLPDLASDGSFEVTYTLTITNDGSAAGTATVKDEIFGIDISASGPNCFVDLFQPLTCNSRSLARGESQSFSFKKKYTPPHLRSYQNTATVTTNGTGAMVESNTTKIKLVGIPERFLAPKDPVPPPATNKGRKR
jgi:hypothetical protein